MNDLSSCCQQLMTVVGSPDFGDGDPNDIHTCYWKCMKCGNPCDPYVEPPLQEHCKDCDDIFFNVYDRISIQDFGRCEYCSKIYTL